MAKICLVRHGETDFNKKMLIQGHTDNPLNDTGLEQAKVTAKWFAENDSDFDVIISSTLSRAKETAQIIASALCYNETIEAKTGFMERNFGKLEGTLINDEFYDILYTDFSFDFEKNEEICERTMSTLNDVVNKYDGKNILIVCHAHTIKSIICSIDKSYDFRLKLANCSINYIEYDGKFNISKLNISAYK